MSYDDCQFEIRQMQQADVEAAEQLRKNAGWNQTQDDWLRLLEYQPDGCFVACVDKAVVGTVTTTAYENRLGWIGMMLVDPAFRRRGIASALMRAAMSYLERLGVDCIKLDATPEGELVYGRLGFQAEWSFHRWMREGDGSNVEVVPTGGKLLALAQDIDAFGVDRSTWLAAVARDSRMITHANAFGMVRNGSNAAYLGPVTAVDSRTAETIVCELLRDVTGQVIWDMPALNAAGVSLCRRLGFKPVRELVRMWTGKSLLCPQVSMQFGLCDPGTG